jgi:hypothetical protein
MLWNEVWLALHRRGVKCIGTPSHSSHSPFLSDKSWQPDLLDGCGLVVSHEQSMPGSQAFQRRSHHLQSPKEAVGETTTLPMQLPATRCKRT